MYRYFSHALVQQHQSPIIKHQQGGIMQTHIALLRAVNVGGTGKLPMADLKALCEAAKFVDVRTYIASGNVMFKNTLSTEKSQTILEQKLQDYAGKPVGVIVLSPEQMQAIWQNNPFKDCAPNRTVAIFLNAAASLDTLNTLDVIAQAKHHQQEEIVVGDKVIYVHYGDGMANSKLQLPAAKNGTARNMNTVAKLCAMSSSL